MENSMRLFFLLCTLFVAEAAYAITCKTEAVTIDGVTRICVTCCDQLGCNTTCY